MKRTLAMILAGGEGSRLSPLTKVRAKPAVPIGGLYRLIDFPISLLLNSGVTDIKVILQYMSGSAGEHIEKVYARRFENVSAKHPEKGPKDHKEGYERGFSEGTAQAVLQKLDIIKGAKSERVAILGGDHVYSMDYSDMIRVHNGGNDLTIAANKVRIDDESNYFTTQDGKRKFKFGVLVVDDDNHIIDFQEKPTNPEPIPGEGEYCLASMGNYIFKTSTLVDFLVSDSTDEKSQHDFGNNIIPKMQQAGCRILAFPFEGYWRDVGTMQSYFEANMDFNKENPPLNMSKLYRDEWKIRNIAGDIPPARLVVDGSISTISPNCDIRGTIRNCVISPEVEIAKGATVENSIIFSRVSIGQGCQIRNAIIDKDNYLPQDTKIGAKNPLEITVVPKGKYQK